MEYTLLRAVRMLPARTVRNAIALVLCAAALLVSRASTADIIPQPVELPRILTLDEALRVLRTRSLDLLIAEAAVMNAEGQVHIANAIPNPAVSFGWGRVIGNYSPDVPGCDGCSSNYWAAGISDSAALEDTLSGKRELRVRVAKNALAAARLTRADALRTIEFQVKSAYLQVALAQEAYDFAIESRDLWKGTLDFSRASLAAGKTDAGSLARIETQKLEADQAVDAAEQTLRQSRVALAFLLGVRGRVPDYSVEKTILKFTVPSALASASEEVLLRAAFDHRADLRAIAYQRASAESQIALVRRQRFPDITLSVNYSQTGNGQSVVQPPILTFGISAPIPLFYQLQGELRQAEAAYNTQSLTHAKTTAQVISDVGVAFAGYTVSRRLVERMERDLMKSATLARDVTRTQYQLAKLALIDFLDAQRTYITTRVEYLQDLTNYWTAVFQLEQAVGMELRK